MKFERELIPFDLGFATWEGDMSQPNKTMKLSKFLLYPFFCLRYLRSTKLGSTMLSILLYSPLGFIIRSWLLGIDQIVAECHLASDLSLFSRKQNMLKCLSWCVIC